MNHATLILAAGKGTRMKSDLPKVLHSICGKPMIFFPMQLAHAVQSHQTIVVLGHEADRVEAALRSVAPGPFQVALQYEQRGTGHAVAQALPLLDRAVEKALILYGDAPLLRADALHALFAASTGKKLAFLSATLQNPTGYGRVVRDPSTKDPMCIVEERDCTETQRTLQEVNAGVYVVERTFLQHAIAQLAPNNNQGELYLTDLVAQAFAQRSVACVSVPSEEIQGVNDRVDLAHAARVINQRVLHMHMRAGVTVINPENVYCDVGVSIGPDTVIEPGVWLRGQTQIGSHCIVATGSILTDVSVGDRVVIKPYTVIAQSVLSDDVQIGPFSHVRPETHLETGVRVGNFVELKKTRMGNSSKANHLSYLGDADIGQHVNIGCGTITCNYDGVHKHKTTILDGAFIGSDSQLVAPVTIGENATVGAGTTVVQDVPAGSLALSRVPQTHKSGYSKRKK